MLYHLGYVSTQTSKLTAEDLLDLLRVARARNRARHISGLLLHREDSFFQVLEGDAESVRQVFESIRQDRRHHRVEVLFEGEIEEREFPDWQMGFLELDGVDVGSLPGFSDFLRSGSDSRGLFERMTETKRLMMLFRAMQ